MSERNPEREPAMKTSIEKLDAQAQQLVDALGEAGEILSPEEDNPNAREYECGVSPMTEAGFPAGTKITIYDEPPYIFAGEQTSAMVRIFIMRTDERLVVERFVTLRHMDDGNIEPEVEEETFTRERRSMTREEIDEYMFDKLAQDEHEFLSQAECDKLLKLIRKEREAHGLAAEA
jgi:hypothetical protein